jgi:hypothetical protein
MRNMRKLTVEFPERATEIITQLACKAGIPNVQILRRAIALLYYCSNERLKGRRICIVGPDNQVKKEIVFS